MDTNLTKTPPRKRLAVLTSGGDAPGMNAAIRAVARMALHLKADVFVVMEGYQGLVDGIIKQVEWSFFAGIMNQGGTKIGSARCAAFRTREGRKEAAKNLVRNGINYLVVIGGDGSLTGANLMRTEWVSLLQELASEKLITPEAVATYSHLAISAMVGSIDNDMCGTDITIGADTALHRILEAVDAILSTASSHQRSFVVEVMGRNCGWLAMTAGLCTGADYVFIPECPPPENWEDMFCESLEKGRKSGRRCSLVIVAEGAIDRKGTAISSQYVRKVLEEKAGHDARITILGHVQRGGTPSALDRIASTLMGMASAEAVLKMGPDSEPVMIGMVGNDVVYAPLMECVAKTRAVASHIAAKEFDEALKLRGPSFLKCLTILNTMHKVHLMSSLSPTPFVSKKKLTIVVMHCGGPSPGMNPAARAFVRLAIDRGHSVLGANNGFDGLINEDLHEMRWMTVNGWAVMGGAELGTNRSVPNASNIAQIAEVIKKRNIGVIVMFGGITGYHNALALQKFKDQYPEAGIPVFCAPGTIANNVPGTENSVGSDTALNNILQVMDKIKMSAVASKRVFVAEVMGADCGYLAVVSAMASGAERAYINELSPTMKDIQQDLEMLIKRFQCNHRIGLIITSEKANPTYSTHFVASLFKEEGKKLFDVRESILGHLQQGGSPSAYDRTMATLLMAHIIDLIDQNLVEYGEVLEGGAVGIKKGQIVFTPTSELAKLLHPQLRRPMDQWWMGLIEKSRIIANSDAVDSHKTE